MKELDIELNQIIKGCINNDIAAQKKLYDLYSKSMYTIALRYAIDSTEAQDIMQDGFIKVFDKLHLFRYEGSFEGWVKRIIVNTAIEYTRRRKSEKVELIEDMIEDIGTNSALSNMGYEELLVLINKLPTGYRTVFNMYIIDGYSHKEIAHKLGVTESTSKSQLNRDRNRIINNLSKLFFIAIFLRIIDNLFNIKIVL